MKKFILIAAFSVLGCTLAQAGENISAPGGKVSNPINADYGGVDASTSAFTLALTTVGAGSFRVYGVVFSTGIVNTDFVRIFDGSSAVTTAGLTEVVRFYNVSNSTGNLASGLSPSTLRWPIRLKKGLCWQASSNAYNSITVLYWQEPK